jgi:hypothetical protein
MIVWSMGRVGSHSVRDWLRLNGWPDAWVTHAACLDDGHLLPDVPRYDPERAPEGLNPDGLERCRSLREDWGTEVVVPVRDPVRRAVSAWTEFGRRARPLESYAHEHSCDGWWARQVERWQGTPLPEEPGWWPGRHRLLLYRVEDGNLGDWLGVKGELPWTERRTLEETPEVTEQFRERISRGRTARHFYPRQGS